MATHPLSASAHSLTTPDRTLPTPEQNGVRYGLLTGAVLCGYTLLAALLGFFSHVEAGSLDVLVLVLGSVLAIRHLRQVYGEKMPYLGGYGTGIIAALVASVLLALFFIIITVVMPHSLDMTQVENLFGSDFSLNLSVTVAALAIVLMGAMSGVITSLIAMQYYKANPMDPLSTNR